MYTHTYVYIYIYIYTHIHLYIGPKPVFPKTVCYIILLMCICIYVYMCIYIYTHTCIYVYNVRNLVGGRTYVSKRYAQCTCAWYSPNR